jgi:signal transduction histidine kinase
MRFLAQIHQCVAVTILAWTAWGTPARAVPVEARLADDGCSVILSTPGIEYFQGGFAATVITGSGTNRLVSSGSGSRMGGIATTVEQTPYGMASVQRATFHFDKEQVDLLFRLDKLADSPVVMLQAGIRNAGSRPVNLVEVAPLAMEEAPSRDTPRRSLLVSGQPGKWLLTGLHLWTPVVSTLTEIRMPLAIYEYGGVYRNDGVGFLFGPVGVPVAYVRGRVTPLGAGRIGLTLAADMSGVVVAPGMTRWGQQIALFMEPPREALVRWTEWVAKTHGSRTEKGALSGWSSWYFKGKNITGKDVQATLGQVVNSGGRLRPAVVQIDNGYQVRPGITLETNDRFPEGLSSYAKRIAAVGIRPGLQLSTYEDSQMKWADFVTIVRGADQKGFTYLKISLQDAEPPPDKTSFEATREKIKELREIVGDDTYLLYARIGLQRVALGYVDANRTGPNVGRTGVRPAIEMVLRSYHVNGRWFAVDDDCYYMATELKDVSPVVGGWPLARTWISMVGLSCGAAFTSDLWNEERFKPYWRNVEVLTPPAKERTEVLDILTSREWPRLVGEVSRAWGDWTVALLWNPSDKEQTVTLDFARAGLDPRHRYAVWSFWDNRFLGVASGGWTTPFLAPAASQHLVFTDLDRAPDRPVLIGSGLHIYCGAAEIERVTALSSALQIELTDAGARAGDLFIYSKFEPMVRESVGCVVDGVKAAGENVWKLSLKDRRHGEIQRVELGIPLPVTRQAWFWVMCSVLTASLVFSGWRYVAWQRTQLALSRLEHQTVLEQERTRIARDLHDDLGTHLTRISAMADTSAAEVHDEARAVSGFVAIRDLARDMTRAMDGIVWAISPARDSLENLADFFASYAQCLLAEAGIRCRLQMPMQLPPWRLSADTRNNLLLAYKEALHNVLKHSRATEVTVGLTLGAAGLMLYVEDNGRGLDGDAGLTRERQGNGLANMRNRLAHLKGICRILPREGGGTRVEFEMPGEVGKGFGHGR